MFGDCSLITATVPIFSIPPITEKTGCPLAGLTMVLIGLIIITANREFKQLDGRLFMIPAGLKFAMSLIFSKARRRFSSESTIAPQGTRWEMTELQLMISEWLNETGRF